MHTILFPRRPAASIQITHQEASPENKELVVEVCQKVGKKVVSVFQPSSSPEKNSHNYIVTFDTGEKMLVRRPFRCQGRERYAAMYAMLEVLKKEGVRVPEFYPILIEGLPYYEDPEQKTAWVFFKYIEGVTYFSGTALREAAKQVGAMHVALRKHYGTTWAQPASKTQFYEDPLKPYLTMEVWKKYWGHIESGKDEYDQMLREARGLVEKMIQYVEANMELLRDEKDLQNIHVDLNSNNILIDKEGQVTIMDFDDVALGNIYTDIGAALHRFITTCLEQGSEDLPKLVQTYLEGYRQGNPGFKIDPQKLAIATYNRALRALKGNLPLKYDQNDTQWLSSIPVNIQRLKQVQIIVKAVA